MFRIMFPVFWLVAVLTTSQANHSMLVNPRIINGHPALRGQFPWYVMLSMLFGDGNQLIGGYCGGSLIHPSWVLTAAHCMVHRDKPQTMKLQRVDVLLGMVQNNYAEQTASAASVVVHESYEPNYILNDIALIQLSTPVTLSQTISPIVLASSQPYPHTPVIAAGFGLTNPPFQMESNTLNYIEMTTLDVNECKQRGAVDQQYIPQGKFCAIGNSYTATCSGDSGGPLVMQSGRGYALLGIVSTGPDTACTTRFPDVFTSIPAYRNWIKARSGV